jgi:hypothetical protein
MSEVLTPVVELGSAVDTVNALAITNPVREALVRDLGPIADKLAEYEALAQDYNVVNEAVAIAATRTCDEMAAHIKTVKDHEVLSTIVAGLHAAHRRFTGLRDCFIKPLEASRKTLKGKVIVWQQAEEEKARKEQARLQAEADAKARAEQDRLRKAAEKLKTPELKQERLEQAEAIAAPVVTVQAPKSAMKMQKRWAVKSVSLAAFLQACIADGNLLGYVTIDMNKLARAKAANTMLEIPGVTFEQKVV